MLGADERVRMPAPGGRIGHAELEIGGSVIMLADEFPDMGARGPRAVGGTPATLHVYVEDVDRVFDRAVQGGTKALRPLKDRFSASWSTGSGGPEHQSPTFAADG